MSDHMLFKFLAFYIYIRMSYTIIINNAEHIAGYYSKNKYFAIKNYCDVVYSGNQTS